MDIRGSLQNPIFSIFPKMYLETVSVSPISNEREKRNVLFLDFPYVTQAGGAEQSNKRL